MNELEADCIVYNASTLWAGLVGSGAITDITNAMQRVCDAVQNVDLAKEAIRGANFAYNSRYKGEDTEAAIVEMVTAGITPNTAAMAALAVYRSPIPLNLYDFCVLYRIPGRPCGKDDPNYLASSLVKGFKRKLSERSNIDDYMAQLVSKGLSKDLLSGLLIVTVLTEGLPMDADSRAKFAQICKVHSIDQGEGEVVFNAVEEFYIGGKLYEYVFDTDA